MLKAAKRLEPVDPGLAREIYLDAVAAAIFAGRLFNDYGLREIAQAVRAAPSPSRPARGPELLLEGFTLLVTDGYRAGVPVLNHALSAFRGDEVSAEEGLRWLWVACTAAGLVWDFDAWDVLSGRLVRLARDAGALSALPFALNSRGGLHLVEGKPILADSLAKEAAAVNEATGSSIAPYAAVALVAFRGREAEASELIEETRVEVLRRGEGAGLTFVLWASAVLYNGLGRYEDALAAAVQAREDSNAAWFRTWGLVELVEAAARCGKHELAVDALDRLSQTTSASGTDWALGVQARSRALLTEGDAAEPLYRQAIEALERTRVRVELARAHLLYGDGCAANAADSTRASSSAPPTSCSPSSAWKRSPNAPGSNSRRPASTPANGPSRPATTSPPRKRKSRASPPTEPPTKKSPRSCSSAPAPSTTTSARPSASSESNPVTNSNCTSSSEAPTPKPGLEELTRHPVPVDQQHRNVGLNAHLTGPGLRRRPARHGREASVMPWATRRTRSRSHPDRGPSRGERHSNMSRAVRARCAGRRDAQGARQGPLRRA